MKKMESEAERINLPDMIFLLLFVITAFSGISNYFREYTVPFCFLHVFNAGKFRNLESMKKNIVSGSGKEVPKSWSAHFHGFGFAISLICLFCGLAKYVWKYELPLVVDLVGYLRVDTSSEIADSSTTLIGLILFTWFSGLRFLESAFVQLHTSDNRIHYVQYLIGFVHYFAIAISFFIDSEGFVPETGQGNFDLSQITPLQWTAVIIFLFSFREHLLAHIILSETRETIQSKYVEKAYDIPRGRFFSLITSPHMFFEIIMCASIAGVMGFSRTWCLMLAWIISHNVLSAWVAYVWNKAYFPSDERERWAIIPGII